jgi:naphthoate synthase
MSKNTKISPIKCNGVARIAFNRPDVRNAFRPKRHQNYTVHYDAQEDTIGVLLSAEGPSSKDGVYSFVVVEIKMSSGHYVGEEMVNIV